MKKTIVLLAAFLFTGFLACKKSDTPSYTPECSGDAPKFSSSVSALISSECATSGCHGSGSSNGSGALTDYTKIKAASGQIRSAVVSGSMPKNKTMSTENRNAIVCWIDAGAKND